MTAVVLDPCCGSRMWWFDPACPSAVFSDVDPRVQACTGGRVCTVSPDAVADVTSLPFVASSFKLVAFDPPHALRAGHGWLRAKYGELSGDWRAVLRAGFAECFRVLEPDGVLVFKWSDVSVRCSEVLALSPYRALFGNTGGRKAGTHFVVFMKRPELLVSAGVVRGC